MNRPTRPATVALVLLTLATAHCDRLRDLTGGKAPAAEEKPLVGKPFASLTKDDFATFCKQLGWSDGNVSFSSSGAYSNVMASCVKEDPNGVDSPDGKKRARLTIALYKTDKIDAEKKAQDDRGAAYVVDGNALFAVSRHDKSRPEAEKILIRLLGPDAAKGGASGVAGPASAAVATAPTTAPGTAADGSAERPFQKGDAIDILYDGSWWKGEVKDLKPGPLYYVHYVGWAASWDEWVKPGRVRPRTATSRTK